MGTRAPDHLQHTALYSDLFVLAAVGFGQQWEVRPVSYPF